MKLTAEHRVHGSHGDIEMDAEGHVTSLLEPDHEYAPIQRFDLAEYARAYPAEPTPGEFDILDLGYWTVGGGYVPPEADFRATVAAERPERALDDVAQLCESFLEHWENDDDDAERRLAAKARARYEANIATLRALVCNPAVQSVVAAQTDDEPLGNPAGVWEGSAPR